MSTVYLVTSYWNNGESYEDFMENSEVVAAFSSNEKAQEYIDGYVLDLENWNEDAEDAACELLDDIRVDNGSRSFVIRNPMSYADEVYTLSIKDMEVQ